MGLAVAVDAAHALLEPHRVPGDVVVDHEPAELEIDPLARSLRRHQNLGVVAELALGMDASVGRVPVANLHATVDLRDGEAPLAELSERTPVPAIADEVVERVLVFGEHEQLHAPVAEDVLLVQHFA